MTASQQRHFHSRFGGLWTDRADAEQRLQDKVARGEVSADEERLLREWMTKGYVVLPRAVPEDVIDAVVAEIDRVWTTLDPRFQVEIEYSRHVSPREATRGVAGHRLVDLYAYSEAAREALFAFRIRRLLQLLFERDALAFQSLSFEKGSQQAIHQDPAYVVVSSPLELVACWVALEDIQEGSGELQYYEGSHRLPDFVFGDRFKHWNPERDGQEIHERYLKSLHEESRKRDLPLRRFQPRKGDALIWHADLSHGGSPITHPKPGITRSSLVTHYCPRDVSPNFYAFKPERRTQLPFKPGCWYTSAYYPLAPVVAGPRSAWSARGWVDAVKPVVKPLVPKRLRSLIRRYVGPR